MSFTEYKNCDVTSENMEQEDKVNVEEASINLGYVKKELNEELAFEDNQYKIALTFENVSGQSSTQQKSSGDSFIDCLDGDVIMKIETGTVKLESYCNKCGGNYQGYCLNCSSLSHILNNLTPNLNLEPVLNTTPTNILEIREVSRRFAVFALKTLPKGIILGPFEGIASIESTTGFQWKIKNQKFVSDENGNWMKYIESVVNHGSKNLDVFHIDGILYFETSREIQEGEELLVCFGLEEKEVVESDTQEEFYLVPVKKEEYPKVFACTLCCLGFRLERCLLEHKSKCPQANDGGSIEDFEIIQCRFCKVWLERQEHLKSHMLHCRENYNRMSYLQAQPVNRNQVKVEGVENVLNSKAVHGGFECSQCSYETNDEMNLQRHLNTHKKPFQCDICKMNYSTKKYLTFHIRDKHIGNGGAKDYQCSECTYETNSKINYQGHQNRHRGTKSFECGTCKTKFYLKGNLKKHIKNKHGESGSAKDYQCSECNYQTNDKHYYHNHLNAHRGIKPFKCVICLMKFTEKGNLKKHIKNKHGESGSAKDYQCSECDYHTNMKQHYQNHINGHHGIKPFECGICQMKFTEKGNLKKHITNKHTENVCAKDYQCSECVYQTNVRHRYQRHLNGHRNIKPFECGICKMKYTQKINLKTHIKNKHLEENGCAKDYQCSECTYQTNRKPDYQAHQNRHRGIKPFECGTCKMKFTDKGNLKKHIKNKHAENGSAKDYQCSECTYETNSKINYQGHQNRHRGTKSFECGTCKTKFYLKGNLKKHIKNKHAENGSAKDYQCSECNYQTNDKHYYQNHLNVHRGIKPFECGTCMMNFTWKSSLKIHIKNKHADSGCARDDQCSL